MKDFLIGGSRPDSDLFQALCFLSDHLFLVADIIILVLCDQTFPVTVFAQTQIRVVLPQQKSVFRAGGHHSVRLPIVFCHQVVDQDSDIGLRPLQNQRFPATDLIDGIDTCNQTLRRSLLISAAAVELTGAEESFHCLGLQRKFELVGIDAVIFDRVGIFDDHTVFQTGNRAIHALLYIIRHGRGHSVHIHFIGKASLGLDEYMMAAFLTEFDHLVLDGRTVAGAGTFNDACINRRPVQILTYDLMCFFIRIGQPAGNLFNLYIGRIRRIGERDHNTITGLDLHFGIIQRSSVHSGRGAGLKSAKRDSQMLHGILEPCRALHTSGTCLCD